ncbi:hypothetical protein IFR04_004780 [Cadophora malorum]|uniref:arginine--tRNA ligase n=1 Tax=Cadophora malorum TaxID=108018 RepID=A0A8H7WBZ9_9HELO|nr:hypothetical protein IFR04_004780 [Cadophora malorum]
MATASLAGLQAFVAELGLRPIPHFPEADILNSPIDIYHSYLAERLMELVDCDQQLVYHAIQPSKTIEDGDLDIVLPKLKLDGIKPKELAGELLNKFFTGGLFAAPFKDGIHIRFCLSIKTLPKILLPYISDRKSNYGNFTPLGWQPKPAPAPEKVIVEFSSPNIAREFTAAHLRSTIVGAFVANIYETAGYSVLRINYLGDWGKNLGLLGVGWQKYGSEEVPNDPERLFRYMHELYIRMDKELQPEQEARKKARADGQDTSFLESQGLFAERDAVFKRMEDGNVEELKLWQKLRDLSIEYYTETYARLGVTFDEYSSESQVSIASEAVCEVEAALKEKEILEEQNGAWIIDFDKHGAKLGSATIRDRNGSSSYLLRDIATVFDRLKIHGFDKMVYIVCEQDVHFRQLIKTVELMGRDDVAKKLQHVTFTKPSGLSSHVGNVQLLGDILDQYEDSMRETMVSNPGRYPFRKGEAAVKTFGINSMVMQELSSRKGQSNSLLGSFSMLDLSDGDNGTSLQLCYARVCSEMAKIGAPDASKSDIIGLVDYGALLEPPCSELLRLLSRYPDTTQAAFEKLEPGTILSYLFRVAEELTLCLDAADEDLVQGECSAASSKYTARMALYATARQVLENGMKLLGSSPVNFVR